MQFADFSALAENCDAELDRLVEKGFLTREDADLVEKDEIRAFFASPLYLRMKNSPSLIQV
jgi:ATP-dependent helicase/nuclease subunit A